MERVTFKVEEGEFVAAIRLALWARRLSAGPFALFAAAPLAVAYYVYSDRWMGPDYALLWAVIAFLAIAALCLSVDLVSASFHARATVRNPIIASEQTFEWNSDGFSMQSKKGESRLLWNDLYGYCVNARMMLLFISKTQFLPVPRRALSEGQFNSLRSAIGAVSVPNWSRWH